MDPNTDVFLHDLNSAANESQKQKDKPDYWTSRPETLVSRSSARSIAFGTGHDLFRASILPAIERAEHEVIFVTCFWARSATLTDLGDALRRLSARAQQAGKKIRVRICFSSCSLTQKLFHTRSLQGRTYPASQWQKKLGLPDPKDLVGLELAVKSIFVLPFSVMHPKFVLIDRRIVLVPSCNVSWEDWFEGCIELTGEITTQFYQFYYSFWATKDGSEEESEHTHAQSAGDGQVPIPMTASKTVIASQTFASNDTPTIFLPSPHHVNPRFSLPWKPHKPAPATPLNIYLLTLFARAEKTIEIQTPNLTAPPVLAAIKAALARGVDVSIVTSERLMILEQLVTAGTTTYRCVQRLIKDHRNMLALADGKSSLDVEAGLMSGHRTGRLRISYFRTKTSTKPDRIEPVQSHLKLTIVDDRIVILGSGNMDRASWYTSQELGVALISSTVAADIKSCRDTAMVARVHQIYDGSGC